MFILVPLRIWEMTQKAQCHLVKLLFFSMKLKFLPQVQNLKNLSKIENTVHKYTKCLQDSGFRKELRMM